MILPPVERQPHLIVALDVAERDAAMALARRLDARDCAVKVGFELFVTAGPAVVEDLQRLGFRVFLDLKFHDIPNTVAAACRRAVDLGVWMLNVHASGGEEMLHAAREAVPVPGSDADTHLLAVTVLTSSDRATLAGVGLDVDPAEQVSRLATLAVNVCGLDGLVCSAHEAVSLRSALGDAPWLVTPGIRPPDAMHDDQKRVVTPIQAFASGVSHIVVGRPITRAADPAAAARQIAAMAAPHHS